MRRTTRASRAAKEATPLKSRAGCLAASLAAVVASFAATGVVRAAAAGTRLDKVTLQLKWVTQAQFAGYYAAAAQGYYRQFGLDVTLRAGGPDITPEQVVASGKAEFGIDWLPSLLSARDKGGDLVNIAQVFNRSGMTELTWKDSGLDSIAKLRGKKVGSWLSGNELELFAALASNGIDPHKTSQVKIIKQPFEMGLFLNRKIDAASAMTYNDLALVLESKNPKTGKLYTLSDLNVLKMQAQGTGTLEDGIFASGAYLKDPKHVAIATRFVAASLKGWAFCRDNPGSCVDMVLQSVPTLPAVHQAWQMNEINALIWPAPGGVGIMQAADFNRTAKIARQFKVIKKAPAAGEYRTDIAKAAVAMLRKQGVNVVGAGWQKGNLTLTEGGK